MVNKADYNKLLIHWDSSISKFTFSSSNFLFFHARPLTKKKLYQFLNRISNQLQNTKLPLIYITTLLFLVLICSILAGGSVALLLFNHNLPFFPESDTLRRALLLFSGVFSYVIILILVAKLIETININRQKIVKNRHKIAKLFNEANVLYYNKLGFEWRFCKRLPQSLSNSIKQQKQIRRVLGKTLNEIKDKTEMELTCDINDLPSEYKLPKKEREGIYDLVLLNMKKREPKISLNGNVKLKTDKSQKQNNALSSKNKHEGSPGNTHQNMTELTTQPGWSHSFGTKRMSNFKLTNILVSSQSESNSREQLDFSNPTYKFPPETDPDDDKKKDLKGKKKRAESVGCRITVDCVEGSLRSQQLNHK